jgi:glucose-specific phosphotransferase system IIA component
VPDPVFSGRLAGDGVAVAAEGGRIVAPAAGRVSVVFPGGHAIGIVTPEGLELLLHIGLDTLSLHGEGFRISVSEGDQLTPGAEIGRFDPDLLAARGRSLVSPVLVTNQDAVAGLTVLAAGAVRAGEPLLRVRIHR